MTTKKILIDPSAGGNATLKKYGKAHYSKISSDRWKKVRARLKAEALAEKK
jgi:hypothetical protein